MTISFSEYKKTQTGSTSPTNTSVVPTSGAVIPFSQYANKPKPAPTPTPQGLGSKVNEFAKDVARASVGRIAATAARPFTKDKDATVKLPWLGDTQAMRGPLDAPRPGMSRLESTTRDILDPIGVGTELASYLPITRGVVGAASLGYKGLFKQAAKVGAKEGLVGGGLSGFGVGLQNPDATLPSVAGSTAIGTVAGGVGGAVLAPLGYVAGKAAAGVTKKGERVVDDNLRKAFEGQIKDVRELEESAFRAKKGLELFANEKNIQIPDTSAPLGSGASKPFDIAQANPSEIVSALNQTSTKIATIARQATVDATKQGRTIDLAQANLAIDRAVISGDATKATASRMKAQLAQTNGTPTGVHDWIESINQRYQGKFERGTIEDTQISRLANDVARILRGQLDQIVDRTGYAEAFANNQALKRLFIAVAKKANRSVDFGDISTDVGLDAAISILTGNPAYMARTFAERSLRNVIGGIRKSVAMKQFKQAYAGTKQYSTKTRLPNANPKVQIEQGGVASQGVPISSRTVTIPRRPMTRPENLLPAPQPKAIPLGGIVLGQRVDASGKLIRGPLGKSKVSLVLAKKGQPRVNPKTGKMEKTFTSEVETVSKIPDLPKTTKSNPQIENLHKQIADNVKAQERALKKGDAKKLSALKKAYNYLIKKWNALAKSIKDTPNKQVINSGEKEVLLRPLTPTYQGAKNLTLKTLDRLKGKSVVSKQFISDLTNNTDLKQPERDLIRKMLEEEGDKVDVIKFGEKVEMELLPLTTKKQLNAGKENVPHMNQSQRYEDVSLPDDLRGPVAKYEERIYESPIKTSAGSIHFDSNRAPNYFAHTRIEDLPNLEKHNKALKSREGKTLSGLDDISDYKDALRSGTTRRVIEVQSDLFQKGRLEREVGGDKYDRMNDPRIHEYLREKFGEKYWEKNSQLSALDGTRRFLEKDNPKLLAEVDDLSKRRAEIARLEPYRNAWQDRIVREEVKQAAIDGKTKLQFPTGETAMKIEGLDVPDMMWKLLDDQGRVLHGTNPQGHSFTKYLGPDGEPKVGMRILGRGADDEWIITHVGENGKFKAVPKAYVANDDGTIKQHMIDRIIAGDGRMQESFDLNGGIDTEDPIYKFYEKEVGRYLKSKYNATRVTDAQGVEWYEIAVDAAEKSKSVQAFGKAPLGTIVGGGLGTAGLVLGTTPSKQQYARTIRNDEVGRSRIDIDGLKNAIALNETGVIAENKRYSYSKPSGSRKYGNDNGKYQITDAELRERSKQFVGRLVSRAEFLANPSLQERYMRGKIEWLIKTYGWGPEEILAAHRGGISKPDEIERIKNERSNYVKKGMLAYLGS